MNSMAPDFLMWLVPLAIFWVAAMDEQKKKRMERYERKIRGRR